MTTTGDTEPSVSPVVINIGGEGEIPGAINFNLPFLTESWWRCSRDGTQTLADLQSQGHVFVFGDMDNLPFPDKSVDVVHTNNVQVNGASWIGPYPQSSEIWRVLKLDGDWYWDGVKQERP